MPCTRKILFPDKNAGEIGHTKANKEPLGKSQNPIDSLSAPMNVTADNCSHNGWNDLNIGQKIQKFGAWDVVMMLKILMHRRIW